MKTYTAILLTAILTVPAAAQPPTDGPSLLFKKTGSELSAQNRKEIFEKLELKVSANGKYLVHEVCGKIDLAVSLLDLNKDKTPEVLISGSNICTSGMTGNSMWLFVKDTAGAYRMNLGFPAAGYKILKDGSNGFPDLRFVATGFCEGVWRWNGNEYRHFKNQPTAEGGCEGRGPDR